MVTGKCRSCGELRAVWGLLSYEVQGKMENESQTIMAACIAFILCELK